MKLRAFAPVLAVAAIALAASFGTAAAQTDAMPAKAVLPTAVPSPVLPAVPAVAPGYGAPKVTPSTAQIVGVGGAFVGISLQDAIGMALLKNSSLAVSASNARIARYQIVEAKAPFDLRFLVEPSTSYEVTQPTNALFAGPGTYTFVPSPGPLFGINGLPPQPSYVHNPGNIIQHQYGFQYGLGGQTLNGTRFSAGIQQERTYNNVTFNAYNPYYIASLNVNVTQPLLKDLGMNAAKHQLELAAIGADNSSAQALVDASNTISKVDDTYWDLVAAWRNVAIQEDLLQAAVKQQNSNVRLARQGAAAPVNAVESQAQVAQFQDSVYSALQNVASLQNELKSLVVTDPKDPVWTANLVPTSPVAQLPAAADVQSVIETARQNRPEMEQARDKYAAAHVDVAYAKNQALPQGDLHVGYQSNGFAGLPLSVPGLF
ncbi:MAG: TolC family protein, partial [Candidatus Eremiobacteraeota bacterium]|nr:TolC family protein [Candidatus Eremiobacteraeota bacterium]